jgi:integrase
LSRLHKLQSVATPTPTASRVSSACAVAERNSTMSVKVRPYRKRGKEGWEVDIRIRMPDGEEYRERVRSPVTSKSSSKFWAEQREAELLRLGAAPVIEKKQKSIPTLREFEPKFMSYSETNNKKSTVYAKRWVLRLHLLPHFGDMPLDTITPAEVEAFKAMKLKAGLSARSVNNLLGVLRKLLNLAAEWGELGHAPRFKALRTPPHEFQFLDFEEAERFVAAADKESRPIVFTALKTGLRVGELMALKWEDVDLVAGRLVVRRTLWKGHEDSPTSGRSREVPLGDDLIDVLKAHRLVSFMRGPYVFSDVAGKRLCYWTVDQMVPRICKKAGLAKRLTMHDLRHSFASHLVMRGVSLKAVQELLGHSSMEMTLRYAHLSPDVKRDAVKLLDRPLKQPACHQNFGDMLETDHAETKTPAAAGV